MATTLPRANLNEQVYDTLRGRLLARAPGPGAKLSLHELASELGVSRSPVHHALTRLV
jgi:DNA-binding GntR family transcriptional regulator